jgi:cyclic pyranopterin phosphate synthase
MTTNGIRLPELLPDLVAAGLSRLNISIDTIRRERFAALTRRDRLDDVFEGIAAAAASDLRPLKLNAVAMRGVNDDELVDLVEFAVAHDAQLRFIEQMPLDAHHAWTRGQMVTAEDILERLSATHTLTPDTEDRGSAPAERWLVDGGPATVGVIASVTRSFCGACDRTRLTADGQIRNCLFAREESDLRTAMRAGATDAELADRWRIATLAKLPGHGIDDPSFLQPSRPMSAIGG